MKQFSVFFILLFSIASFAQKQAIIISNKYDFQKEKNSYNINNMLKAILVSNNYQVYFDDAILPIEIAQNRCNALTGVLIDNSNVFSTKMKFQIKDCQNNLLFETLEVKSKNKDIQTGYIEAIGLLGPELKKYKVSLIQKKEDGIAEKKDTAETPSISEFKTFLNCSFQKSFDDSRDFEIGGSAQNVLLFLQKTKNPNIFIAYKEGANGVFTKTGNKGVFEYYIDGKYMVEEYLF
jgi:GTPase involved in cell partitioning and DNA repair